MLWDMRSLGETFQCTWLFFLLLSLCFASTSFLALCCCSRNRSNVSLPPYTEKSKKRKIYLAQWKKLTENCIALVSRIWSWMFNSCSCFGSFFSSRDEVKRSQEDEKTFHRIAFFSHSIPSTSSNRGNAQQAEVEALKSFRGLSRQLTDCDDILKACRNYSLL